ncbi:glycoside hydrolase family 16 protein [Paraburkholderia sp.]|uniref:glycoside hydrolase family 16 protein n=1 Tax=Paraburkholderia sp. TaxID=1926495 RepID=UPI002600FC78|nr:glycoside hydrolase family 16 protein [Paraburkholderia sp.]
MRRSSRFLIPISILVLSIAAYFANATPTAAAKPHVARATVPDPALAPGKADIDLTGYTLTFNDEFDDLSVTTRSPKGNATWYYVPPYGPAGNFSASTWDIGALGVTRGVLSIKAFTDANGAWHSGNISSMDATGQGFAQRYGYFEVRARMPRSGTGSWPAFWLLSSTSINNTSKKNYSEIDIFEWYGNAYTEKGAFIQEASHNWKADGNPGEGAQLYSPATPMPNGAKPWEDFHIYGCQIDPDHITWYIDGVQTNRISAAKSSDYMTGPYYIMLDYALGGGWPIADVRDGSTFDIDWVRVYSLPQKRDVASVRSATDSRRAH